MHTSNFHFSFVHVQLRYHCPNTSIILVGTKLDMRKKNARHKKTSKKDTASPTLSSSSNSPLFSPIRDHADNDHGDDDDGDGYGDDEVISTIEGEELSKQIGCRCYMECSALTREGLKEVFDTAILAALNPKYVPKRGGDDAGRRQNRREGKKKNKNKKEDNNNKKKKKGMKCILS